jgi:hypothetical protein
VSNKNYTNPFSWSIDPEELKNQVDNYNTLSVWKSYRKQVVLAYIFFIILGFLVILFAPEVFDGSIVITDALYSLILYMPVLFFAYRGHRLALGFLMLFWSIEQGYKLVFTGGQGVITVVLLWYILMVYLYKAIKVENARIKMQAVANKHEND